MKKLLFIYNPFAGKSVIKPYISDIADIFTKGGFESVVMPTQGRDFCRSYIAENAERFDIVAISGGDGTLNEAVNGLMAIEKEKRPRLGYIPSGTTNDFAASVGLENEFLAAASAIVKEKSVNIDAGRFNEKYFAYIAAFGAFTDVAYDTPQEFKNIFGHAAYIIEGIKRLSTIKPYRMKITTDEGELEGDFIYGMVTNTLSVGGLMKLSAFNVDMNDGVFEAIFVKAMAKPSDLNAIMTDLRNRERDSRHYRAFKTKKLKITSHEKIAWTLDGEFGGECTEAAIENIHSAIELAADKTEE